MRQGGRCMRTWYRPFHKGGVSMSLYAVLEERNGPAKANVVVRAPWTKSWGDEGDVKEHHEMGTTLDPRGRRLVGVTSEEQ